jgi:hypothetical protein
VYYWRDYILSAICTRGIEFASKENTKDFVEIEQRKEKKVSLSKV